MTLSSAVGDRLDLVPRADVQALVDAYQQLAQTAADDAWARGVDVTAQELYELLRRHEPKAAEAARGVAHTSVQLQGDPTQVPRRAGSSLEQAAGEVARRLRALKVGESLLQGPEAPVSYVPIALIVRASDSDRRRSEFAAKARAYYESRSS